LHIAAESGQLQLKAVTRSIEETKVVDINILCGLFQHQFRQEESLKVQITTPARKGGVFAVFNAAQYPPDCDIHRC
jgi:hypothetical protein